MFDQIPKLRSMATKEAVALTSTIMKSLDVNIESAQFWEIAQNGRKSRVCVLELQPFSLIKT